MNFNPYDKYFYHGYGKNIYQINYETTTTLSYYMSSSELYYTADDATSFS